MKDADTLQKKEIAKCGKEEKPGRRRRSQEEEVRDILAEVQPEVEVGDQIPAAGIPQELLKGDADQQIQRGDHHQEDQKYSSGRWDVAAARHSASCRQAVDRIGRK